MNKFHFHFLDRFLIGIALICSLSVPALGGVLEAGASSSLPESKDQAAIDQKNTIYNDTDPAWKYSGHWSESKARRACGGQIHLSTAMKDQATVSINGSRFTLIYSTAANYGKVDVFVDGRKIGSVDQKKSKVSYQKEWLSPRFGVGPHVLKFVHASGKIVSIDAINVRGAKPYPNPAPTGAPSPIPSKIPIELSPTGIVINENPTLTSLPASTASPVPSATMTQVPTFTSTASPAPLPSSTPTLLPTFTASPIPSKITTSTPSQSPTALPGFTATTRPTSTLNPTATNTALPTFTSTTLPTTTNTSTAAASPTATANSTPIAGARVFYVSVSGSDSNPGSQSQPWRSIQKAAKSLVAGDTVYVRGGVYNESVRISNSGTQSQPIRFLAYPGETPVIDGNNYQLPTVYWGVLLEISGNYIQVSGLEIRYSNWMGVVLSGQHDLASNMNVHHSRETGMLVSGDYGIVENSRVWQNANRNETNTPYGQGGWATGLSAARHPNYAVLRGNTIYNNWGEGLSTFEANGTVMEDNVVYDNWSTNVYISDATNVLLQRNLVYGSDNSLIKSGSRIGIEMGDEVYNPPSSNITIINNLVYGNYRNFFWWQGNKGGGLLNVLIANNSFINSRSTSGVQIDAGPHQNVRFYNNIVQQDGSLPVAGVDSGSGITFSHNLWSKKPPSIASGAGDIIADPLLTKTGNFTSPAWYQLQASSPARDSAVRISEVVSDFFGKSKGDLPDIGAFEY